MKNIKNTKFVVIGGGTGTFSVLSGLKKYTENITAVVNMADSGGSAKKERDEWGLLPSSDVRKSLIALSDISTEDALLLRKLFQYRYKKGVGLKGMTFGNLFLVTLAKLLGSQKRAISKAGKILQIKGRVLPVTLDKFDLVAQYEDESTLVGEHFIDEPKHNGDLSITKLSTRPLVHVLPTVEKAILGSDVIIIGPGGFYTTILSNLVIQGVPQAIIRSRAKKIFILNLMTEFGQTYKFTASRFISELGKYVPADKLDCVFINNALIPKATLVRYRKVHAEPVKNDFTGNEPFQTVACDLLSPKIIRRVKGDTLRRSFIRHDGEKIASLCMKVLHLI